MTEANDAQLREIWWGENQNNRVYEAFLFEKKFFSDEEPQADYLRSLALKKNFALSVNIFCTALDKSVCILPDQDKIKSSGLPPAQDRRIFLRV